MKVTICTSVDVVVNTSIICCVLCVLSQCCLFLWFVHYASCFNIACVSGLSILCLFTSDTGSIETRHNMDKPETQAVLGQDTEWKNQRHRQHWDKTQYCLFLWFVHYASCFNIACVSGLSILCLFSMLPVSVVCPFTEWTNQRHRQYWDETHNGQTRVTSSIGIRHRTDKPRHRQL
jgi:hypothetical protein